MAKRKRSERARRFAETHPECTISVEVMCHALAAFRESQEWQAIGERAWWRRWCSAWFNIAWQERQWRSAWWASTPNSPTLHGIFKRPYTTQSLHVPRRTGKMHMLSTMLIRLTPNGPVASI